MGGAARNSRIAVCAITHLDKFEKIWHKLFIWHFHNHHCTWNYIEKGIENYQN